MLPEISLQLLYRVVLVRRRQVLNGHCELLALNQLVIVAIDINLNQILCDPDGKEESEHDQGVHHDHQEGELLSCVLPLEILDHFACCLVDRRCSNVLVGAQHHHVDMLIVIVGGKESVFLLFF